MKTRLLSLILGPTAMLALCLLGGCSDVDDPTGPTLSPQAASIDSLVFALPAIKSSDSGEISTSNGTTSYFAGDLSRSTQNDIADRDEFQTIEGGYVWGCQEHDRSFATVNDEFPLLSDNADVIWPGAALQGASLYRATPDPITAPRGPGVLIWSQINGNSLSSVELATTTHAGVIGAADSLLAAQTTSVQADVEFSLKQINSTEDLQIAVNASADYFGLFGADANFSMSENVRYNYFLVSYRQNTFTLVFQRPSLPHEFFGNEVDVTELNPHVGADNPPAYVSAVTYGRALYLLVRSSTDVEDMHATLNANFTMGLFGGELGSGVDYITELEDLEIQWYVYGGSSGALSLALSSGSPTTLTAFKSVLEDGEGYEFAKPVFATIRSVKSDELIRNGYNMGYTYTTCQPLGEVCVPGVLAPQPGSVLDNGCSIPGQNSASWDFSWTACSSATKYQLQVWHPNLGLLVDESNIVGTSYTAIFNNYFDERNSWKWKVRGFIGGAWAPWSSETSFGIEPVDADCNPRIVVWQHNNYTGDSRTFYTDQDFNDLDRNDVNFADQVSSVQVIGLEGVKLYRQKLWGGNSIVLFRSHPNLSELGFDNQPGSGDIYPFDR